MFSIFTVKMKADIELCLDKTNEFLHAVGIGDRGLGAYILEIWQHAFTMNASQPDTSLSISKKEMIWPLIVSICGIDAEDALFADCDEGDIEDIRHRYNAIIHNNTERFEFATRVLSEYNAFNTNMKSNERTKLFIETHWNDYQESFDIPYAEQDILETIVKLTISNVIKRRRKIIEIKSGVNL